MALATNSLCLFFSVLLCLSFSSAHRALLDHIDENQKRSDNPQAMGVGIGYGIGGGSEGTGIGYGVGSEGDRGTGVGYGEGIGRGGSGTGVGFGVGSGGMEPGNNCGNGLPGYGIGTGIGFGYGSGDGTGIGIGSGSDNTGYIPEIPNIPGIGTTIPGTCIPIPGLSCPTSGCTQHCGGIPEAVHEEAQAEKGDKEIQRKKHDMAADGARKEMQH